MRMSTRICLGSHYSEIGSRSAGKYICRLSWSNENSPVFPLDLAAGPYSESGESMLHTDNVYVFDTFEYYPNIQGTFS
jgi:hypothetical protein